MFDQTKTLFTGNEGLLGGEVLKIFPNLVAPSEKDFDVTCFEKMDSFLAGHDLTCIFHAAAFTSPPLIDQEPMRALEVNISGTANIVKLCIKHGLKLVYISTDYVFNGESGNYAEDSPVYPVNKYAWSKLGGECAVRLYDNSLIIRTTFGPNTFPFPKAFVDQWTSREGVSTIAAMICRALEKDITGVLHIGGPRKTVFEYAKGLNPEQEIGELRISELSFPVPRDTSLNTARYQQLLGPDS